MSLVDLRERFFSQNFSRLEELLFLALVVFIIAYAFHQTPAEKAVKKAAEKEGQIGVKAAKAGAMLVAAIRACQE